MCLISNFSIELFECLFTYFQLVRYFIPIFLPSLTYSLLSIRASRLIVLLCNTKGFVLYLYLIIQSTEFSKKCFYAYAG